MSPCGGHAAPMSITVSCARPWPQGCSSYLACELASCVGFGPVSVVNKEFFLVWLRPPASGREWLSFRGPVRRHLTMPQPRGSVAERGALDAISFVPEAKPLLQCLGLPSDMARMASSASAAPLGSCADPVQFMCIGGAHGALLSAYSRLLAGALLLGPRVACLRKSSS